MRIKISLVIFSFFVFLFAFVFPKSALAATFTLSGKVTDNSSNPFSGATIDVRNAGTTVSIASTTTDSGGNYSVSIDNGTYDVQVTPLSSSGFGPAIALSQNISADITLNFILVQAGSVTLSGHIYDPSGNPVPGQTLRLVSGTSTQTTTDGSGFYSLQVSAGTYSQFLIFGDNSNPSLGVPKHYEIVVSSYSLPQSTVLNITLPAKRVDVHVQDGFGNAVSNVGLSVEHTGSSFYVNQGNLSIGGGITNASGRTFYTGPATDGSGNAVLWVLPTSGGSYNFTATPPSGSIYSTFTLNNVSVTSDQTEIISLQFNHDAPVTTAVLSPAPNAQGEYSDPTTVTLSATAASGFTIANTYYTVDGGAQQTYSSPFQVSGDGQHTITFWSIDNVGVFESPNTKTFTIHVNQAPSVSALSNATINEGGTYSAVGSFTDPDSTSWTATVDYGDGSEIQSLTLSGTNFPLSHVYKDNGTYTVTVSVTDNQGATGTRTATITVNNSDPNVGTITASTAPQQVNTPITASAPFTDPGVLDTHTALWDFGDGTTSNGTITESNGSGSVSDTHIYTAAGVYTITLTVTDKDGGVGLSIFQYVVVYDPAAGYVTGAGTITSPQGAYTQDPSLSGKAVFGFVSKYQNGANVPEGSTQFRFIIANFSFKSTSYDWLVVGGARAQYKGSGTINGSGDYGFMLTSIDGQINGGGGVDKFRIKITDKITGNVIYDNQLGGADTSDPTTVIDSGSITIHN